MGFGAGKVEAALREAGADTNGALDLLSRGEMAAAAPAEAGVVVAAVVPPAGDGRTRARSGSGSKPDHFRDQTPADAPESALIDQRVSQLVEMGFDGKKAESALALAQGDFNGAVNLLSETGDRAYSDDSPLM